MTKPLDPEILRLQRSCCVLRCDCGYVLDLGSCVYEKLDETINTFLKDHRLCGGADGFAYGKYELRFDPPAVN